LCGAGFDAGAGVVCVEVVVELDELTGW